MHSRVGEETEGGNEARKGREFCASEAETAPAFAPSPQPGGTAQKERAGFFAGPTSIRDKEGAKGERGAFSVR